MQNYGLVWVVTLYIAAEKILPGVFQVIVFLKQSAAQSVMG